MRRLPSVVASCAGLAALASVPIHTQPAGPPPAAMRPVVDTYHGVSVSDPYRWLEDWNSADVRAWTDAQSAYTRGQLDALPFIGDVRARVQAIGADTHPSWSAVVY